MRYLFLLISGFFVSSEIAFPVTAQITPDKTTNTRACRQLSQTTEACRDR